MLIDWYVYTTFVQPTQSPTMTTKTSFGQRDDDLVKLGNGQVWQIDRIDVIKVSMWMSGDQVEADEFHRKLIRSKDEAEVRARLRLR